MCRTFGLWYRVGLGLMAAGFITLAVPAHAFDLYKSGRLTINGDFSAALAVINSERSYNSVGVLTKAGKRTWFEGLGTYGVSGSYDLGNGHGTLFGAFDLFSGADQGQFDAAGISDGDGYQTQIQNAYIGWKSGDVLPWLGHNGLQISAGRQAFILGTGFLIRGDQVSFGKGFNTLPGAPGGIERAGGTYYLGSLNDFSKTAILQLGGKEGPHFTAFWLASDNKAQAETHLAGANFEYRNATYGTVGLTYFRGLDVSHVAANFLGNGERKGQNVYSIYGNTSLGVKQLNVEGQYVYQANNGAGGDSRAHAWYLGASWTFQKIPWTPKVTYRFNRFSPTYNTWFYGFNDFGTWFYGEVASNYAGPFNTAADIQMAKFSVNPTENLQLATYYTHFGNIPSGAPKLQGNEVDAYAEWTIFAHYTVIPLIGYYKPKHSAATGGTQLGGNGPNIYSQLLLFISF